MAEQEPVDEGSMSLIEHLTELRNRIGFVMLGFVVVFLACFIRPFGSDTPNIAEIVYLFLQAPLAEREEVARMIFTALHEGFFTQVKVAFFCVYLYYTFLFCCFRSGGLLPPGCTIMSAERFIRFAGYACAVFSGCSHGLLCGYPACMGFLPVFLRCRAVMVLWRLRWNRGLANISAL